MLTYIPTALRTLCLGAYLRLFVWRMGWHKMYFTKIFHLKLMYTSMIETILNCKNKKRHTIHHIIPHDYIFKIVKIHYRPKVDFQLLQRCEVKGFQLLKNKNTKTFDLSTSLNVNVHSLVGKKQELSERFILQLVCWYMYIS